MSLHVDLSWILEIAERAGQRDPAPDDLGVPLAAVARHRAELIEQPVYGGPYARAAALWCPIIDAVSRQALARWKATHQAQTAGRLKVLKGGNVEELWDTTAPGRPRGGQPAPPLGLPAAI
jgi:hypothetical protein